jgi:hypothetical protein
MSRPEKILASITPQEAQKKKIDWINGYKDNTGSGCPCRQRSNSRQVVPSTIPEVLAVVYYNRFDTWVLIV